MTKFVHCRVRRRDERSVVNTCWSFSTDYIRQHIIIAGNLGSHRNVIVIFLKEIGQ